MGYTKVVIKKSYKGNGKPTKGMVAMMQDDKAAELIDKGYIEKYDGPVPVSHNIYTYQAEPKDESEQEETTTEDSEEKPKQKKRSTKTQK